MRIAPLKSIVSSKKAHRLTKGIILRPPQLDIVILGLSITSSWGNGHATTYRCLVKGLARRGHRVRFLERDVPWYASNRDLRQVPYARTELYESVEELRDRYATVISAADMVIIGSFVPDGAAIGEWITTIAGGVTVFYDIDTPVTLARLERGETACLTPAVIPKYDLYLSFTGGPTLDLLENAYGARRARPLYCAVDQDDYFPEPRASRWALGFMGTYSVDRQPALERLLFEPARQTPEHKFVVAGSMFPSSVQWPENVDRIEHLPPGGHRAFYNSQKFTLNLTRAEMIRAGYSPSVRLFEAAACGTPIISDAWLGLSEFFAPGREILIAQTDSDVMSYLRMPEEQRLRIAENARAATLARHTGLHRAQELEQYYLETAPSLTHHP